MPYFAQSHSPLGQFGLAQSNAISTSDREKMEDTGRKRKRYNTFRASSIPLPPKRSLRRHIRSILSAIPLCNESIKSPADANVEYLPLESQSSQNESFFQTADKYPVCYAKRDKISKIQIYNSNPSIHCQDHCNKHHLAC